MDLDALRFGNFSKLGEAITDWEQMATKLAPLKEDAERNLKGRADKPTGPASTPLSPASSSTRPPPSSPTPIPRPTPSPRSSPTPVANSSVSAPS